jgi:hypothetical protein
LPDPLAGARLEELKAAHPRLFDARCYRSTSERDFALACLACKLGWPQEDAVALIRAVQDGSKADRPDYLWRTVGNGYERAPGVQCAPPGRPYANAKLFLQARYSHPEHQLLVHQGGEWYRWDGSCWPVFDQGQLRAKLYEYFEPVSIPTPRACRYRLIPRAARLMTWPTR